MKKTIAKFWHIFKTTPLGRLIKWLSPQWLINLVEHLPMALLANFIYGFPSRKITVIGVTGTDGKTTTVNMIYKILKDAGLKASMISTINASVGGKDYDTGFHVTSPHSLTIQEFIKKAVAAGDNYIVLEVTSHSMDQHRFFGVKFDVVVITNITHEHLDYHKSFENYRNAKAKLLRGVKWVVLNFDDPSFEFLKTKTSGKVVSFGKDPRADINPRDLQLSLKIPGNYNILNALAAAGVAESVGIKREVVQRSLNTFSSLKGRMEEIKNNRGIRVFIDFAHTPNGLENALETLRTMAKGGKVISVIGCEGYRDTEKRSMMGEVSAKLADYTIVTAVDPRGLLKKINQQILDGIKKMGGKLDRDAFLIDDRKEAIKFAIKKARRGDVVGIFGKGHEISMNLDGKEEISWSDLDTVQGVLHGR